LLAGEVVVDALVVGDYGARHKWIGELSEHHEKLIRASEERRGWPEMLSHSSVPNVGPGEV
jgi:hypothetical protein